MRVNLNGRELEVHEQPADFWAWKSFEPHNFEFLGQLLKPDVTFLDLGAWVGPFSMWAVGKCKRIAAVEPDPVAFAILEKNAKLNPGFELVREAVSDHDGTIKLGSSWLGCSTTRANPLAGNCAPWAEEHTFEVKCSTLSTFAREHELTDPLVIKMDVEGSEEQVLTDIEFIREHRPALLISMHPFWWNDKQVAQDRIFGLEKLYSARLHGSDIHFWNA